jgi:hypothetical protein
MDEKLPPPSWQRAVEADDYVAVIVLLFAILAMAAEAFAH